MSSLLACWLVACSVGGRDAAAQQPAGPAGPSTARQPQTQPVRQAQGQSARQAPRASITPQRVVAPQRTPFPQLTPAQQQQLDQVLVQWEQQSSKIKTFTCRFKRWDYINTFNDQTVGLGEIKYGTPDKGMYRFRDEESDPKAAWDEYWVCDGASIFEFDKTKKELIERRLPKEMQGTAISDGPFPFLFGASAEKLKDRYWLRLIAPPPGQEEMVALEAYPKLAKDAANFRRAELLLTRKELILFALRIDDPNGKDMSVHQFYEFKSNDPFQAIKDFFAQPRPPRGWKHTVEDLAAEPVPVPPGQNPRQAQVRGPAPPPQ